MVKRLLSAVLACAVVATCWAVAGDQDFTLVNKTGVIIDQLYVSPTGDNEWGEDVLGVDTLPNGKSVDIAFAPEEAAEYWDIKIVDTKEAEVVWKKIKLTQIAKITLTIEKGQPTATME